MLSLVDVPDVTTAVPLRSLITGVVRVLFVKVWVAASVTIWEPLRDAVAFCSVIPWVTFRVPVTAKLSSTVVVPLAESRVKLPLVVSISALSILTWSTIAVPVTASDPFIDVESKDVTPSTFKLASKSTLPVTSKVPGRSTLLAQLTVVPSFWVTNTWLSAPSFNL